MSVSEHLPTREEAFSLLCEFTSSSSLQTHALAVEASMRFYANSFAEDVSLWGITGLLHDFDYERFPDPTPDGHPYVGCRILKERGYPEEVIQAILGHAHYTGVPRVSLLAKSLFACDELSGLVFAAALVRPDRSIHSLEVKSVKKKLKDKTFARGVNRDDVRLGADELGIELDTHIRNIIEAMRGVSNVLGLSGDDGVSESCG